ncbi:MAG: ABC transporter substrate-binding protein [Acidimicrobiales bacterium]|jgi:peptide/nickel transport system substrate-binding protein
MKRWLKQGKLWTVAASGLMVGGLLCGVMASTGVPAASGDASPVLTMESSPASSITNNFNPYQPTSASVLLGATSLIYEPLLQFDVAQPTKAPYDFLASGYSWGKGGKSITFTIRSGVKFSNGTAMTPADVAFTYTMLEKNPSVNTYGVPISGVSSTSSTVTVDFSASEYTNLQNVAGELYIVPESQWSAYTTPGSQVISDTQAIGTGPYVVSSWTPQGFTLKVNPNYWGGPFAAAGTPPAVKSIYFPALTSNSVVLSQLVSGSLTWAGNFITGLQKAFVGANPATNHVWFAPVNTVTFYPNLTRWPTNQLVVRQAISLAVNRTELSKSGEGGGEPPATNASGLTLPNFQSLISASVKKDTLPAKSDIAGAKRLLEKAGYTRNSKGYFEKNGKVVALTIGEPAAYTDYAADAALAATELRKAGIDATFVGQSVAAWGADITDGHYQLDIHWGTTSISAYQLYNYWLNSTLYTASPKAVTGDFERLVNKSIDKDLATLAGATTLAAQAKALAPIESFVATQLPVIPILYGASFDEYSTAHFTGWPSASHPYESGSPNTPTNEVIVLHLSPTS